MGNSGIFEKEEEKMIKITYFPRNKELINQIFLNTLTFIVCYLLRYF